MLAQPSSLWAPYLRYSAVQVHRIHHLEASSQNLCIRGHVPGAKGQVPSLYARRDRPPPGVVSCGIYEPPSLGLKSPRRRCPVSGTEEVGEEGGVPGRKPNLRIHPNDPGALLPRFHDPTDASIPSRPPQPRPGSREQRCRDAAPSLHSPKLCFSSSQWRGQQAQPVLDKPPLRWPQE